VLARGPKTTVLVEGLVEHPWSSVKTDHENITNPFQSPRKAKTVNPEPKRTAIRKK
jgi:hypothetical protein